MTCLDTLYATCFTVHLYLQPQFNLSPQISVTCLTLDVHRLTFKLNNRFYTFLPLQSFSFVRIVFRAISSSASWQMCVLTLSIAAHQPHTFYIIHLFCFFYIWEPPYITSALYSSSSEPIHSCWDKATFHLQHGLQKVLSLQEKTSIIYTCKC